VAALINITLIGNPSKDMYYTPSMFISNMLISTHALTREFLLYNNTFRLSIKHCLIYQICCPYILVFMSFICFIHI